MGDRGNERFTTVDLDISYTSTTTMPERGETERRTMREDEGKAVRDKHARW